LALLEPLREAGYPISDVTEPKISLSAAEQGQIRMKLEHAGVNLSRPIVGFAVGSREPHKSWPLDRMAELIHKVRDSFDAQIVLLAGLPTERQIAARLQNSLADKTNIFKPFKTNGLRELIAQIACCNLFVGNEGGPRHMAAAVGVPTVSIVSPSASKLEWLGANSKKHAAIEWRDIDPSAHSVAGSVHVKDPHYQRLYDLIEPHHVYSLISEIVGSELI